MDEAATIFNADTSFWETIGDVSSYKPELVKDQEFKEFIGTFRGVVKESKIESGETNGKSWAKVCLTVECLDEEFSGRKGYITIFLGSEPSIYSSTGKSQTQDFLDLAFSSGLSFPDASPEGFKTSIDGLVGQECWFKSYASRKKNDEGKWEFQYNDSGYKKLKQNLVKEPKDSKKPVEETGNPYL